MWELKIIDTDKPLYMAIAEALERDIRSGVLSAGEKLPTHRELAQKVGVNVTTATRAYNEAEKRGLVTAVVGNGTFVTSDLGESSSLLAAGHGDKGYIEMGLALPLYSVEPDINQVLKKILNSKQLNISMQYTSPQGLASHRHVGAQWVRRFGVCANANNVIVTSGVQHALHCILLGCFEPGNRIAVDYLTYPGFKAAARRCGIKLEGVMMDHEGMIPSELEAVCKRHNMKGIYISANLQNPTNATMSESRRIELIRVIQKYDLLLLEDDLYRFLADNELPELTTLIPEKSIYIAGVAKAFYAGLRTAFVVSPRQYYNKICQAVVDTVFMAPGINAEIACECINSGLADVIIQLKREEISRRASIAVEMLQGYELSWAPYSMFIWLKLPDEWNSIQLERATQENGVNVIASDKFTVSNTTLPNYIRISLTSADNTSELVKGIDILLRVLRHENDKVVHVI